jgi:hypothetical protein
MPDANTKLLLHFNGSDGDTSTVDSSDSAHPITFHGSAELDVDQNKFGSASLLIPNTTNDGISTLDSDDWAFGTDEFTIDFWVRFAAGHNDDNHCFISQYQNSTNRWEFFRFTSTDKLQFYWVQGGTERCKAYCTWTPSAETWYHIMVSRSGSNIYIFINGVSQSLTVDTAPADLVGISGNLYIGCYSTLVNGIVGHIEEFRISDVCRETSNFTPPSEEYWVDYCVGVVSSLSSVTGSLTVIVDQIYGSLVSASVITGSLKVATQLIGSFVGSSSLAGYLKVNTKLIGSSVGSSSLAGSLKVDTKLIGSSVGSSSLVGSLKVDTKLVGSSIGSSSLAGSLNVATKFISSIGSTSGITASLNVVTKLIGYSVGVSNLTGSLKVDTKLIGSLVSASSLTGSLIIGQTSELIGYSVGVSNLTGSLKVATQLIGYSVGTLNLIGSLKVATKLVGDSVETSSLTGSLTIVTKLIGYCVGSSSLIGYLKVDTKLIGSLVSASNLIGSLTIGQILEFAGFSTGISNLTGSLKVDIKLIGTSVETSSLTGSLIISIELGSFIAECSASSASLGVIEVLTKLIGEISSTSSLSGFINIFKILYIDGAAACISELTGELIPYFDGRHDCTPSSSINGYIELSQEFYGLINGESNLYGFPNAVKLDGAVYGECFSYGFINIELSLSGIISGENFNSAALLLIPDFNAAVLFWRPQANIVETLEWKTSILKSHNGTEQRIKIRKSPRQYFKLKLILNNDKINTQFDSVIHAWQKENWLIPIWTEFVRHTEDINAHDFEINVDTTFADFRDSNKAMIWQSQDNWEVVSVTTKTNDKLNLDYSVLSNYSGEKFIIPVRTAYVTSYSRKEKQNSPISIVELVFSVYDNINIIDYEIENSYDSFDLLTIPAFMNNTHEEISDGDILLMDFKTGIFKVDSNTDFNIVTQNHIFFNDSKQSCWKFRQFLHYLCGRQKSVLIPTFRDDIIQANSIEFDDSFVEIENIKLAENMGFNKLRKYIGFYFNNGNLIIRKIENIEELNDEKEKITFNYILGNDAPIEVGDCKICFVDKCRLSSDRVEIKWPNAHRNECETNFVRVI